MRRVKHLSASIDRSRRPVHRTFQFLTEAAAAAIALMIAFVPRLQPTCCDIACIGGAATRGAFQTHSYRRDGSSAPRWRRCGSAPHLYRRSGASGPCARCRPGCYRGELVQATAGVERKLRDPRVCSDRRLTLSAQPVRQIRARCAPKLDSTAVSGFATFRFAWSRTLPSAGYARAPFPPTFLTEALLLGRQRRECRGRSQDSPTVIRSHDAQRRRRHRRH